jgi:hypothetical protein
MTYGFYNKNDNKQEIISKTISFSRLSAAKSFANRKNLELKSFLKLYSVKKIK